MWLTSVHAGRHLSATERRLALSECMTLQWRLDALRCLHAHSERMQTPLNLWGPLYNN